MKSWYFANLLCLSYQQTNI